MLLNQAVPVLVDGIKGLVKFGLVEVVGRRAVCKSSLQEALGLRLVQSSAVVRVKLIPDFVDSLSIDTLLLYFCSQSPCEGAV